MRSAALNTMKLSMCVHACLSVCLLARGFRCKQGSDWLREITGSFLGKMNLCSDIISRRGGWEGFKCIVHIFLQHKIELGDR